MLLKNFMPALLIISVIFISGCASQAQNVPSTGEGQMIQQGNSVGDKAPDFLLTATDGRTLNLSQLTKEKRPVVIYFMATWCPFCKEEYGEISKAYAPYSYKVGLISVSIDLRENADVLEKYRASNNRPGLFAPGVPEMLERYNVLYTTTKYAINKDGTIVYKRVGNLDSDSWKTIFDSLQ